jgi:L,D-transpeptidase ErfK/SrfK
MATASEVMPVLGDIDVIGSVRSFRITGDETLLEVARLFDLGFNEIGSANPAIDPWVPGEGNILLIPAQWVLPDSAKKGVVINLAEMRLYQYLNINGKRFVRTYPIGVGVDGSETPTGTFRTGVKLQNPTWYVPKSIREENPDYPVKVPPGEDNPLGKYAIKLKGTSYFLHGTNEPYGIGREVSHGCIRLYPEDIEALFRVLDSDTLVNIIYQPVKVGVWGDVVYVEVHQDYRGNGKDLMKEAVAILRHRDLLDKVDMASLEKAVKEARGMPVVLMRRLAPRQQFVSKTNAPNPSN